MKRGVVWAVFFIFQPKYFVNMNVLLFDNQASPPIGPGIFELVIVSLLRPHIRNQSAEIPLDGVCSN